MNFLDPLGLCTQQNGITERNGIYYDSNGRIVGGKGLEDAGLLDPVTLAVLPIGGIEISAEKLLWEKASQMQMEEVGKAIAGAGTRTVLRDAERIVAEHGGNAADWAKMTSTAFRTANGGNFQTHWYENVITGLRVEYKTIIRNLR